MTTTTNQIPLSALSLSATLLAGLASSSAVGQVEGFDHANIPAPGQAVLAPNPEQVYHGLFNIGTVPEGYAEMTDITLGRAPGIVLTFHDWNAAGIEAKTPVLQTLDAPLEGEDEGTVLEFAERIWDEDGSILALVWDPITYLVEHPDFDFMPGGPTPPIAWADLLSGVYDDYIRAVARQVRDFARPIMITPFGEYNVIGYASFGPLGNEAITSVSTGDLAGHYGDPAAPDGPERVRDVFRRIVDIFDAEGADNVTWFMYSHTAYMNPADLSPDELALIDLVHPRHYYPGDDSVDWIGNSAYVSNDDPEMDLDFAIGAVVDAYATMGVDKPFFLTEMGVVGSADRSRAERITRLLTEEIPAYPNVRAMTFADSLLFELFFDTPDLATDPAGIKAWNAGLRQNNAYTNRLRFGDGP